MKTPIDLQCRNVELMRETGKLHDSFELAQLALSTSPVFGGKLGEQIAARQFQRLRAAYLLQQLEPRKPAPLPTVKPEEALQIGDIIVPFRPGQHGISYGMTGCGKTNLIKLTAEQLRAKGYTIEIFDHSGEWPGEFPDAPVFYPDTDPTPWFCPIGPREPFYFSWAGELSRSCGLAKETWTATAEIAVRVTDGLKSGDDPFPSLKDFERVLFKLREKEGRSKLATAAFALRTINAVLGKNAYIRSAPDIRGRFPIVIYQCCNLPHNVRSFLSALRLLRLRTQALLEGNNA